MYGTRTSFCRKIINRAQNVRLVRLESNLRPVQESIPNFRDIVARVKKQSKCSLSKAIDSVKRANTYEGAIRLISEELLKIGNDVNFATSPSLSSNGKKEGLICIVDSEEKIAMVMATCKTDFMSATSEMHEILKDSCVAAINNCRAPNELQPISIDTIHNSLSNHSKNPELQRSIQTKLFNLREVSGEPIEIKEAYAFKKTKELSERDQYICGYYVHTPHGYPDGFGKIGSMVLLEIDGSLDTHIQVLTNLVNRIARHIVGCKPVTIEAKHRDNIGVDAGKDKVCLELNELFGEALLEQNYLFDDSITIAEHLKNVEKETGLKIRVKDFKLIHIG